MSFYGALSYKSKKEICQISHKQDSVETIKFLELIKAEYKDQDGVVLLVWDNASWHKSKEVKKWLEENPGVVELMNFPPYSPDLNPQEHVWKEMKREVSKIVGLGDFNQVVDRACRFLNTKRFDYKFV